MFKFCIKVKKFDQSFYYNDVPNDFFNKNTKPENSKELNDLLQNMIITNNVSNNFLKKR